MKPQVMFYVFLVIGVILESIGDYLFRKSYIDNKKIFLIIGYGIYITGSLFWGLSLEYENLSEAILWFVLLNAIIDILVGLLILNEQLTIKQYIGIFLALLSLYCIEG